MKLFLALLLIMGTFCFAQDQEDKKQSETEVTSEEYVYRPMGRKDPFVDELKGSGVKDVREHREGLAGLYIDELELQGILTEKGVSSALFRGPDSKPYIVRVGDEVYDGKIVRIDSLTVVFKQITTVFGHLGGKKEKLIYKRLKPEEEGNQL